MDFDWPENSNSNQALLARALPFGRDAIEREIKWKDLTRFDKYRRYWNERECRYVMREHDAVWIDVSKLDAMLRRGRSVYVDSLAKKAS